MSNRPPGRDRDTGGDDAQAGSPANVSTTQSPPDQRPRLSPYTPEDPNDPNDPDVYKQKIIRRLRLLGWRTLWFLAVVVCVTAVYLSIFLSEALVLDFVKARLEDDLQSTGFWAFWMEAAKPGAGMLIIVLILLHVTIGALALLEYLWHIHREGD